MATTTKHDQFRFCYPAAEVDQEAILTFYNLFPKAQLYVMYEGGGVERIDRDLLQLKKSEEAEEKEKYCNDRLMDEAEEEYWGFHPDLDQLDLYIYEQCRQTIEEVLCEGGQELNEAQVQEVFSTCNAA